VQKFRYARHRIIYQLLLLADMFGTQTGDGIRINPPLTHFDIGSSIGMARETVTREMEKLRSGSCLISSQQHIVLTDTTGLQAEIEDAH
jgi:CRP-like cAMP-binding protein